MSWSGSHTMLPSIRRDARWISCWPPENRFSVSLLGLALQDRGISAVSLTASQCGIQTDSAFNIARIESIDTRRIDRELDAGRVVIVTGFQGLSQDQEVTTLGRGGSDITGAAFGRGARRKGV